MNTSPEGTVTNTAKDHRILKYGLMVYLVALVGVVYWCFKS